MTKSTADPPPFGRLSTTGQDTTFTADCNALAVVAPSDFSEIMIASIVGPQSTIKAFKAVFHCGRSMQLLARGCGDCCGPTKERYLRTENGFGYRVSTAKLGYDSWHLLAINERPDLIPCYSQRSVLAKLKSQQFTTPILDGWLSYICKQLRQAVLLKQIPSFGCDAGILRVSDKLLDDIVSHGIKTGELKISKEAAHV